MNRMLNLIVGRAELPRETTKGTALPRCPWWFEITKIARTFLAPGPSSFLDTSHWPLFDDTDLPPSRNPEWLLPSP
jgi:hypothetical protein